MLKMSRGCVNFGSCLGLDASFTAQCEDVLCLSRLEWRLKLPRTVVPFLLG